MSPDDGGVNGGDEDVYLLRLVRCQFALARLASACLLALAARAPKPESPENG